MQARRTFFRRTGTVLLGLGAVLAVASCGTLTSTERASVDASASFAVLAIENLSSTPLAGRQAATLIENRLRRRGVERIATYRPAEPTTLVALMAATDELAESRRWANESGYHYALSGAVHEWHYKSAPDREPVVAVTLTLTELKNDRVLWQGTASKSGWGSGSLSGVADKVIATLLSELRLVAPSARNSAALSDSNG